MAITIITDSTSDFTIEEAAEKGVVVIPLTVYFGEESYLDGIDLDTTTFFDKMEQSKELPTTSQVNFLHFEKVFSQELEKGNEVIGIFLSSKLSGTYQSAKIAKTNLNDSNIHIIDSGHVTLCLHMLVDYGLQLKKEGKTVLEIVEEIEKKKEDIFFLSVIEDLTYLKKGGRLSAASTAVGTVLGIKPLVTAVEGEIQVAHKVRGVKNAYQYIIDQGKEAGLTEKTPVVIAHAKHQEAYDEFKTMLIGEVGVQDISEYRIGATVGTYAGPTCLGMCFFKDRDEKKEL